MLKQRPNVAYLSLEQVKEHYLQNTLTGPVNTRTLRISIDCPKVSIIPLGTVSVRKIDRKSPLIDLAAP